MKKILMAASMLLVTAPGFAQMVRSHSADRTRTVVSESSSEFETSYNRLGISYTNTHFGINDQGQAIIKGEADEEVKADVTGLNTNGFSIDYAHGWSLSRKYPMYLEAGLRFGFSTGGKTIFDESFREGEYYVSASNKASLQNMNFTVPVNFVWRFNVSALGEDFVIAPYTGINFRLNLSMRGRLKTEINGNFPPGYEDMLDDNFDTGWFNLFSSDKIYDMMLGTDPGYVPDEEEAAEYHEAADNLTWKRFQMGWQIGVNFEYGPYCLGLEYGLDFLPAYSKKWNYDEEVYIPGAGYVDVPLTYNARVNTGTFRLALGYRF